MLIPKLSIRWILGVTTAMAVFFVAVRQAIVAPNGRWR